MAKWSRFEELTRPHMDAAYNLAFWILRHRDDADDAVQEGYLRAYRAFAGFRGDAMRPWLLAIVRNSALRLLQSRKRTGAIVRMNFSEQSGENHEAYEVASPEPNAELQLISNQEREKVLAALSALPTALREVIVLRELEELSYADVASVLGVPVGTVMSRLSRARAQLKRSLIADGKDC